MSSKKDPRKANGHARRMLLARHRATVKSGKPCYICGRPIDLSLAYPDPWSFVVDETVPVARGGDPYSWGNTGPAHRWCNQIKGTHSLAWAREEVARILSGQKAGMQTKPTVMPLRKLGL